MTSALLQSVVGNGQPGSSPTVIIPSTTPVTVSKTQFIAAIKEAQQSLADIGIGHGSTVSLSIPNSYEFTVLFFAIASQRAVAAPLNPAFKEPEFKFFLGDLTPAVIVIPAADKSATDGSAVVKAASKAGVPVFSIRREGWRVVLENTGPNSPSVGEKVAVVTEAGEDDVALVLHTSGTTGRPKSVPLTHKNITQTMANIQATYLLGPSDRSLLVMPLFHIHGLVAGLLSPLSSGGSVIIPARFSASTFWADFVNLSATWYTAVPTIHQILLNNEGAIPKPLPKIRFIRSCSSPLAPAVFHALEKRLKAPVLEAYAMTEAAHQIASNPLPPKDRIAGSVGIPQGVEVRILAPLFDGEDPESVYEHALAPNVEGEVGIRGLNVTAGYINNPSANATAFTPKERFFRTGDNGKLNEAGYLFLTGRIKEMINRGGEKISPVEIDNVTTQHPDIAEATAFAAPDQLYGQTVGIAVVRREGGKRLEGTELLDWLRPKLSGFKLPEKVYFTKVMPKTATGKIQRRLVASAMLEKSAEQSVEDGDVLKVVRSGPIKSKL